MKLKLNQKSLDRVEADTKARLNRVLSNKEMLGEVGDLAVDLIRQTTRKGTSTVTDQRFKPLSKPWIKKRDKIASSQGTHPTYAAKRSNLTLSGQLIDSIKRSVVGRMVTIFFDGSHLPYRMKTRNGISRVGKIISNSKLAQYVADGGRPFFGFSKAFESKLLTQVKKVVIRYIRRNL